MDSTDYEHIKICHVNCQSLFAHMDEFRLFFSDSDFHIICMSETWLRTEISDALVSLPGYTLHRCDRVGRQGGGVAFYIANGLHASVLCSSYGALPGRPEFLIAEISSQGSSKLLLAVVYRPPNIGYLSEFFELFSDLRLRYRHSVILGDFNADMCRESYDRQQVLNYITALGYYLVSYNPTHNLKNSSTWLDLCIADDPDKIMEHGQQDVAFLSAHDLIYVRYKIRIHRRSCRSVTFRDWRSLDAALFQADIERID